jgi:hypothetical protein
MPSSALHRRINGRLTRVPIGGDSQLANARARHARGVSRNGRTEFPWLSIMVDWISVQHFRFTGGITDENLWFIQCGNNLKIDLLGTNTSVTVNGWFSSSSNQLQEITAGGLKIDSQISQLVQAIATYSANNSGFDPTSSSIQTIPNDTNLQSTLASSWHA